MYHRLFRSPPKKQFGGNISSSWTSNDRNKTNIASPWSLVQFLLNTYYSPIAKLLLKSIILGRPKLIFFLTTNDNFLKYLSIFDAFFEDNMSSVSSSVTKTVNIQEQKTALQKKEGKEKKEAKINPHTFYL